jgi:O-antigen/teichoic acid export membrane protein
LRKLINAQNITAKASALIAGKWVQDAFRFLLLLWLARTSQSGFGLFVFGAGVAAIIHSFLALGFDQFTIRELTGQSHVRERILGQMIRLKTSIGLLALGMILAFGWLNDWNRTETLVVLIISAGIILDSVADTFFSFYRYAGSQVQEAACCIKAALFGALYGAAAFLAGGGVVAVSLFVVVTSGLKILLAATGGIRAGLLPKIRLGGSILPPERLSALLVIAAVSFFGSFYNQIQVLLLKHFKALGDVALYGAAMELAGGLAGLVSAFVIGGVLYPALVRTATQGPAQLAPFIQVYFWRLAAFGLGIAFFYLTLGQDLLLFVYGRQYAASLTSLQILGLATFYSFMNNFFIHAFLVQHQERLLLWLHVVPAILSLALGLVLIPRLGASGAALNLLACRGMMTVLILTAAQWHFGILSRAQVGAFLGGGLILGATYWGLLNLGLATSRLPAILALFGYVGWTWRWTMSSASFVEAKPEERCETS